MALISVEKSGTGGSKSMLMEFHILENGKMPSDMVDFLKIFMSQNGGKLVRFKAERIEE